MIFDDKFSETAFHAGLSDRPDDNSWMSPTGYFGVVREADGLIYAVAQPDPAKATRMSKIGVSDDVAADLVMSWCPDAGEIDDFLDDDANGVMDLEFMAQEEAVEWVRKWDRFAPGAIMVRAVTDQLSAQL